MSIAAVGTVGQIQAFPVDNPVLPEVTMARLSCFVSGMILFVASSLAAQGAGAPPSDAQKRAWIKEAMSAAPLHIAKDATILAPGPDGQMMELRHGTNGWTCFPDQPDTPGKDPMCIDEEGMKWASAWMAHDEKPGNTTPGLAYMLMGGSDISANDPWAKADKKTKFVASPPHYMVLWPFDPATTGLPAKPKRTGTWIMWAGTPYAHLMVNQVP